jgi:lipid-A-disaccharide synthase
MQDDPVFVLVAGEASGDLIGASIIRALLSRVPNAKFVGVGGPFMIEAGLTAWHSLNELSVMGITEVLRHLPRLLRLRTNLADRIKIQKPIVFIGIDAPDFNLGLADKVRSAGIPTVHVVSPSVWAWRQGRLKTIARAIDLMLPLFPFEQAFYESRGQSATCIGHPLADEIPLTAQPSEKALADFFRKSQRCTYDPHAMEPLESVQGGGRYARYLAVLPGSRQGELKYIAPVFLKVMAQLAERYPNLGFLVPCANARRAQQLSALLPLRGENPWVGRVHLAIGGSREAMAAADAVLVASGTATLEAMLLKKPMVVAYRWHMITHAMIAPLVKTPYVSLPNLLAGRMLVPELVQEECTTELVTQAVEQLLSEDADAVASRLQLVSAFTELHKQLQSNAAEKAADEIMRLCGLIPSAPLKEGAM